MKAASKPIPEVLIYEMVNGLPIYYQGYKDYLKGTKQLEQLMGSSYLQSLIITRLVYFLMSNIDQQYLVLTNEVGLQFSKNSWRAADIAIIEKSQLRQEALQNKYLSKPPKVVIEIDTKANMEAISDTFNYFHKKTDELLAFGVETVIWIFTESEKVMIARKGEAWVTQDWNHTVSVIDNISIHIGDLVKEV